MKNDNKYLTWLAKYWFVLVGVLLFSLVFIRAFTLPPYADEITTYFQYIRSGQFQPFHSHLDANNHVINSFLSHLSFLTFGDSMWAFRLPNVLSFILFWYFINKLRGLFDNSWIGGFFAISVCCSMYMLSFFSVTRGYGMSMAFLAGSLYHLWYYQKQSKSSSIVLGLFLISLAVWSNLSLIPTSVIVSGAFFILWVKNFQSMSTKAKLITILSTILIFILPLVYAILFSIELKQTGLLYLGDGLSFYQTFIEHLPGTLTDTDLFGQLFFIVMTGTMVFVWLFQRMLEKPIEKGLFSLVLLGSLILIVIAKNVFDVNYPVDRAGMHYYILFLLGYFAIISQKNNKFSVILAIVPAVFIVAHFASQIQFRYVNAWRAETVPVEFYEEIYVDATNEKPIVAVHGLLGVALEHHAYLKGENHNGYKEIFYCDYTEDYILLSELDVNLGLDLSNYVEVLQTTDPNLHLYKRKQQLNHITELRSQTTPFGFEGEGGTLNLVEIESLSGEKMSVNLDYTIKFSKKNQSFWIVVQVRDKNGEQVDGRYIDCRRLYQHGSQELHFTRKVDFKIMPDNVADILVYVWNTSNKKLEVKKGEIEILKTID